MATLFISLPTTQSCERLQNDCEFLLRSAFIYRILSSAADDTAAAWENFKDDK